jgi:hypothetical protein
MKLYALALLLSPLAVALSGTVNQAAVNLGLWVTALLITPAGFPFFVLVPMIHAVLVVHWNRWDEHLEELVREANGRTLLARPITHGDVRARQINERR